jgi:hypothetical protein
MEFFVRGAARPHLARNRRGPKTDRHQHELVALRFTGSRLPRRVPDLVGALLADILTLGDARGVTPLSDLLWSAGRHLRRQTNTPTRSSSGLFSRHHHPSCLSPTVVLQERVQGRCGNLEEFR